MVTYSEFKQTRVQNGFSSKELTGLVVFLVGSELFQLFTESRGWIANLVGLALWSVVTYLTPPRPKLWKLLIATACLTLLVFGLHLLHIG